MRQNRRRTGSRRSDDDKIKYIRMAAIPMLVVVILVVIIVLMDKKSGDKETSVTPASETSSEADISIHGDGTDAQSGSVEPDNNQYTTDFSQYELQKDEIPQVNLIISEYFQAKVDQDAEKLFQIFGKPTDESLEARREELKSEAVYIEDYQDIVCYTKPGITDDSYVVYVTYEVKFRRVDTLAPGLMWCYVLKDGSGNYIIRENVVGDEADYVAKQNQSEDVRLLSNQVNERLRQAIESDTLLAGIYKDLRNGAVVSSSASDEEGQDSRVILEEEGGDDGLEAPDAQTESGASDGPDNGTAASGQDSGTASSDNGTAFGGQDGTAAPTEAQGAAGSGQSAAAQSTAAGDSNVKIE